MIVIARHHIGRAADHGLQRLRAALEVDQLDLEPGLIEFAELLCDVGRDQAHHHEQRELRTCGIRDDEAHQSDEQQRQHEQHRDQRRSRQRQRLKRSRLKYDEQHDEREHLAADRLGRHPEALLFVKSEAGERFEDEACGRRQ